MAKTSIDALHGDRSDEFYTPRWVYEPIGPFDLDPCAGPESEIASVNYRLEEGMDGLTLPWQGLVWCNPPYSGKPSWINRMKEHGNGILLLPDSTFTPWFIDLAKHCQGFFLMGKKIRFIGTRNGNFRGSALFPFGPEAFNRLAQADLPGCFVVATRVTTRSEIGRQRKLFT